MENARVDVLGGLIVLLFLGLVLRIAIPDNRVRPFSGKRASTKMRSPTGPNLGSVVLVLGVAAFTLEIASWAALQRIPYAPHVLVGFAVLAVVGVVLNRSMTEVILGLLGVVLTAVAFGIEGTLQLIVIAAFLVWFLGLARGRTR